MTKGVKVEKEGLELKNKEGGESGKSLCSDSTAEISVSDECVSIRVCLK